MVYHNLLIYVVGWYLWLLSFFMVLVEQLFSLLALRTWMRMLSK